MRISKNVNFSAFANNVLARVLGHRCLDDYLFTLFLPSCLVFSLFFALFLLQLMRTTERGKDQAH